MSTLAVMPPPIWERSSLLRPAPRFCCFFGSSRASVKYRALLVAADSSTLATAVAVGIGGVQYGETMISHDLDIISNLYKRIGPERLPSPRSIGGQDPVIPRFLGQYRQPTAALFFFPARLASTTTRTVPTEHSERHSTRWQTDRRPRPPGGGVHHLGGSAPRRRGRMPSCLGP